MAIRNRLSRTTSYTERWPNDEIGSLEMQANHVSVVWAVHCRIGSLEMQANHVSVVWAVHCRIGSLETLNKR